MLATTFEEFNESIPPSEQSPVARSTHKYLKFGISPVIAQPKLDGVRCLAVLKDNEVILYSRTGKAFTHLKNIKKDAHILFDLIKDESCVLDGELFYLNKQKNAFQHISSIVAQNRIEKSKDEHLLEYHIFDINLPHVDQLTRLQLLKRKYKKYEKQTSKNLLQLVPSYIINSYKEANGVYDYLLKNGYEGVIYRASDCFYQAGKRSACLRKRKPFYSEEVIVTGYTEASGTEEGCIVWQFEYKGNDKKMHKVYARPKGSFKERRKILNIVKKYPDRYIGRKLTIEYGAKTDLDLPRFPVALGFRDEYE